MPAPITKRLIFVLALTFATAFALAVWAEELLLRRHEDQLRFAAPKLHFVAGRAVDRLKEGNALPVDFQATLAVGSRQNVIKRLVERFVISYDLWEERFKVVRLSERKSASNLTAQQAEAWCFENLGLSLTDIPKDQPLYFKLEIRTADSNTRIPLFHSTDNFNLTALINLFSRPPDRQQWHWTGEAGPFGYADLSQSM